MTAILGTWRRANLWCVHAAGRFHVFNPNPGPQFIDLAEPVRYDAYNELATQYTIDAIGSVSRLRIHSECAVSSGLNVHILHESSEKLLAQENRSTGGMVATPGASVVEWSPHHHGDMIAHARCPHIHAVPHRACIAAAGDLQVSFYVNGVLDTANIFDFGPLTTPSFPEIVIEVTHWHTPQEKHHARATRGL